MRKKRGFTIIELLIVMAVIAILVGIAIPSFRAMQTEAWRTKAEGDVRVLKIALESLYKNTGFFPAVADTWQNDLTNASPRVLESVLNDPFNPGKSYKYTLAGSYYVVYSVGANGDDTTTVTISDTGVVTTPEGSVIYETNGY